MPILTLPLLGDGGGPNTPRPAKAGDYVIALNSTGTWVGHTVTHVTATRYYYNSRGYVTIKSVVWVGAPADGQALLAQVKAILADADAAAKQAINAKGGWA
jgi:hypothetical protein